MDDLSGKTAIVTGAASGIGLGIDTETPKRFCTIRQRAISRPVETQSTSGSGPKIDGVCHL